MKLLLLILPSKKTASVKKNMQLLHGILQSQTIKDDARLSDEQCLLAAALSTAKERVVVKRPARAPLLGEGVTMENLVHSPHHSVSGSLNRWDVYSMN